MRPLLAVVVAVRGTSSGSSFDALTNRKPQNDELRASVRQLAFRTPPVRIARSGSGRPFAGY